MMILPEASFAMSKRLTFTLVSLFAVLGVLAVAGCDSGGGGSAGEVPSAPSGLSAVQQGAQVSLNWNTVTNAESYNVYRAQGDTEVDASGDAVNGEPVSGTSFTDDAVQAGTVYSYSVTAVGAGGQESDASASVTLRVFAEPPSRP